MRPPLLARAALAALLVAAFAALATAAPPSFRDVKDPPAPAAQAQADVNHDDETPPTAEPGPAPELLDSPRAFDPAPLPRKTDTLKQADFTPEPPPLAKPKLSHGDTILIQTIDGKFTEFRLENGKLVPVNAEHGAALPKLFDNPAPPPVESPRKTKVGQCSNDCGTACKCSAGRSCRGTNCPANVKTPAVAAGEQAGLKFEWHDLRDYPGWQMYGYVDARDGLIHSGENANRYRERPAPPLATGLTRPPVVTTYTPPVPITFFDPVQTFAPPASYYFGPQVFGGFGYTTGDSCATGNCGGGFR